MAVNQTLNDIKNALALQYPVIIGLQAYTSFESDVALSSGNIPMPDTQNEILLGGHCVLLIGYDDSTQLFTFMNSWGTDIGQNGFFTIPYNYVINPSLAFDFWAVTFFK